MRCEMSEWQVIAVAYFIAGGFAGSVITWIVMDALYRRKRK